MHSPRQKTTPEHGLSVGQRPNGYAMLVNSKKGKTFVGECLSPDDMAVCTLKLRLCSVAMNLFGTKSLLTHSSSDNHPQTNESH